MSLLWGKALNAQVPSQALVDGVPRVGAADILLWGCCGCHRRVLPWAQLPWAQAHPTHPGSDQLVVDCKVSLGIKVGSLAKSRGFSRSWGPTARRLCGFWCELEVSVGLYLKRDLRFLAQGPGDLSKAVEVAMVVSTHTRNCCSCGSSGWSTTRHGLRHIHVVIVII